MPLLSEYVLTPDIFDQTSYSSVEISEIHLQNLKEYLLDIAVVRDLRNGEWGNNFSNNNRPWLKKGQELLKKLKSQNRLKQIPPALDISPITDNDWCREGLETHLHFPLNGVIVCKAVSENFTYEPLVAPIDRLSNTPWWADMRSPSVQVKRHIESYLENLNLLLRCANSIMFIDPHFDPQEPRYGDFKKILKSISSRTSKPLIEIHRVCYKGSGQARTFPAWEDLFKREYSGFLHDNNLKIKIFIWDDFHDRYIITDLLGISAANGFDTTSRDDMTMWNRLGRNDRDKIQREFDLQSNKHTLRCPPFCIGPTN